MEKVMSDRGGNMNMYTKCVLAGLLLCVIVTVTPFPSLAQATTGTIAGTVTDPSSAVIVGVTITLRNIDTNITRTAQTGPEGRYTFPACRLETTRSRSSIRGLGK